MREIKFRAWEFGKMYYQVRCGGMFDGIATSPTNWNGSDWVNLTGGEHTKVMQYTGLKDKNDKEIYEGDIVQAVWYSYEQPECENFGEVIFNNSWLSFCVWNETDKTMSEMNGQGYYTWEIEVIGNIYENPNLLKE